MIAIIRSLVIATLLSSCAANVEVHEFIPANSPAGINATVKLVRFVLDGNRLEGELLAADEQGFLLLLDEPLTTADDAVRLVEVPRDLVREIKLAQIGSYLVRPHQAGRDDERLQRFRLLSRYPQGMDNSLRNALLAELGQPAVYSPQKQP